MSLRICLVIKTKANNELSLLTNIICESKACYSFFVCRAQNWNKVAILTVIILSYEDTMRLYISLIMWKGIFESLSWNSNKIKCTNTRSVVWLQFWISLLQQISKIGMLILQKLVVADGNWRPITGCQFLKMAAVTVINFCYHIQKLLMSHTDWWHVPLYCFSKNMWEWGWV